MSSRQKSISRRTFFRNGATAAGAGLGALIATRTSGLFGAVPPSDRIAVGFIGVGARAQQIMDSMLLIPGVEIVRVHGKGAIHIASLRHVRHRARPSASAALTEA